MDAYAWAQHGFAINTNFRPMQIDVRVRKPPLEPHHATTLPCYIAFLAQKACWNDGLRVLNRKAGEGWSGSIEVSS